MEIDVWAATIVPRKRSNLSTIDLQTGIALFIPVLVLRNMAYVYIEDMMAYDWIVSTISILFSGIGSGIVLVLVLICLIGFSSL